ncbi:unnamed protein product [Protopolystoma xenopodis]|uniref:Uncharacterized protein n=1 Tax=Protopolystoma xenopodis TaxID=117903 RepID=A0A448WLH4_9PLAT|nr:unnamed protein product [Protopolystoma xenopodis]
MCEHVHVGIQRTCYSVGSHGLGRPRFLTCITSVSISSHNTQASTYTYTHTHALTHLLGLHRKADAETHAPPDQITLGRAKGDNRKVNLSARCGGLLWRPGGVSPRSQLCNLDAPDSTSRRAWRRQAKGFASRSDERMNRGK